MRASLPEPLASPCIRAPTDGTSRRTMCGTSRGRWCATPHDRAQHRRRSAPGTDRSRARGQADSVHAGSRLAWRNHEPGWMASWAWRRSAAGGRGFAAVGWHPRQSVRRRAAGAGQVGGIDWRGSRRAVHRAVRAGLRGRPCTGAGLVRRVCPCRPAGARGWPRRQRRTRSRSREPRAVPDAAASGRGLDRPRASSPAPCSSASRRLSASTSNAFGHV